MRLPPPPVEISFLGFNSALIFEDDFFDASFPFFAVGIDILAGAITSALVRGLHLKLSMLADDADRQSSESDSDSLSCSESHYGACEILCTES
jgi:hypothetical protein